MPRKHERHAKEKAAPKAEPPVAAAEATVEAEAATEAETTSIFGKVDCVPFVFANEDDDAVYTDVESVFDAFQTAPSTEAFAALQNRLAALAGFPLVTAVLAGRYPHLFSSLKKQEAALGEGAVVSANVAGVDWDLWCRNTWLSNSCAVDDLGAVAQSALPGLDVLLRQVERDNDNGVNEVWSVLHVLAWALRCCDAAGDTLVGPLTQSTALWELIERELVPGGRHTGLQLVLLELLGALGLHVSASSTRLCRHLCTVAGARAAFAHPMHFHTAMKLCYACAVCDDEAQTQSHAALRRLKEAWAAVTAQADAVPAPLRATEWVIGDDARTHLEIAVRLHQQLVAKAKSTDVLDLAAVQAVHTTVTQLPTEARAFCFCTLPGNPLLRLHAALQDGAADANVVTEVVATLVAVVFASTAAASEVDGESNDNNDDDDESNSNTADQADIYVQCCIQLMWMDGLNATLHSLLQRREPAITAAVARLLHHLAARSQHGSAVRRVLLGAPSLSLVGDVLSGVAETADVKAELQKAAVADVVDEALRLVCALEKAELTSVFADSLVFTVGTLISEGKENVALLRGGLRALAHLAAAFPMAGSLVLDFEFLMEQCAVADAPTDASAALVVGSLDVMSAIVVQQPAAVTFEWIEVLLSVLQNLDGWRDGVAGLDAALWRCVRRTVEVSEDCYEYLFSEEAQEVLRNELERMRYHDAHFRDILPSLLGIAVCVQACEHAAVNAATAAALANVPATSWTAVMCETALRFLVAAAASDGEENGEGLSTQRVATLAAQVMDGAHASNVTVPPTALAEFANGVEAKGLASAVVAALFDLADESNAANTDATSEESGTASLPHSLLPLLHCILSNSPSARTEATATRAAHLLTRAADSADDAAAAPAFRTPEVVDAVLLLVNDACAANFVDDDDDITKRTDVVAELWPSLARVTQQAAEKSGEAGWQRVVNRAYAAAHALLLGSTVVPFRADGDPRLDYIGSCGLPHVAIEPCNALVQTVLHYDAARAYLQHKYTAAYLSSLQYMADPSHNTNGVVPLPLLGYLDEAKKA